MSGRPKKIGLEFFPHDTALSSDLKIEAVEAVHGITGYGVYLKLLEIIYREGKSPDMKTPATTLALAGRCHLPLEQFSAILKTCVDVDLFEKEAFRDGILTSNGIRQRSGYVDERRESAKQRKENWRREHVPNADGTCDNPQKGELSRGTTPENGNVPRDIPTNGNGNGNGNKENSNTTATAASREKKAPKERDILRDALNDSFLAKIKVYARPQQENSNLPRLASAIRAKSAADGVDERAAAQGCVETFWRLHETGKEFWLAFTPSRMLSQLETIWAAWRTQAAGADVSWVNDLAPRTA